MTSAVDIYRLLQQHLDDQAVGFPAAHSGADIRLLKRLFTPDEARLALHLTYQPTPTAEIGHSVSGELTAEEITAHLESMFAKGSIAWKKKDDLDHWSVLPMVIGIYEQQDGDPSPEFLDDADAYMKTLGFGRSFINVKPSQMRTIPIGKSLQIEHHVAPYDQIRELVDGSAGPFVVLPCICRRSEKMKGNPCAKTERRETCLAFGDMAAAVLRRGHGRNIEREEVMRILARNEEDGLVLQPSNTRQAEFVCSCCGCCCGMLAFQKYMPRPLKFWTSNYQARVDPDECAGCGSCLERCQVNAIDLTGPEGEAQVKQDRCIGCGLCVTDCPSQAIMLSKKEQESVPPLNEEELLDEIRSNRKGVLGQMKIATRFAIDRIRDV